MAHGGRRTGAGRRTGSANKRTAAAKIIAVAQGITPAEVMHKAMEVHYKAKRYDQAAEIAKDLAPYVHPRLSSVQHAGHDGGPLRLVEELVVIDGNPDAAAAVAPGTTPVLAQ